MKIGDIYKENKASYSIEVFPPKNGCNPGSILSTVESLKKFNPSFVSITYGALGNARGGTIELATKIKSAYQIETMAHLTCVGKSRQELENILVGARYSGVDNILALRGDMAPGKTFKKKRDGHSYAYQLVRQIALMNEGKYLLGEGDKTDFSIGVACYPEGHKDNPKKEDEPMHLKMKQDSGAEFAITQMFFDNEKYLSFVEHLQSAGVTMPVIPGIMPLKDTNSIAYITGTFGTSIPKQLAEKMSKHSNDKDSMIRIGLEHSVRQCEELLKNGVKGIHFYTMNRPEAIEHIMNSLQTAGQ